MNNNYRRDIFDLEQENFNYMIEAEKSISAEYKAFMEKEKLEEDLFTYKEHQMMHLKDCMELSEIYENTLQKRNVYKFNVNNKAKSKTQEIIRGRITKITHPRRNNIQDAQLLHQEAVMNSFTKYFENEKQEIISEEDMEKLRKCFKRIL